ncbi:hypothetical protein V5O48_001390 [Marasmius crinis-equi]|uniref:DUF6534 domain-containing protein n=1 Tax=Marasmius crinis-equi TaxID=585013 RepID=A0ABR3FYP6_9AGAR
MQGPAEVAHGPMFIGFLMNVVLYGIMITQVYLYFASYKRDKTWMKFFNQVLLLFLCDTVNSIFDAVYLYASLILHFADVEYLGKANWVFATDPVMTAIIAILVQGFFAWRIKVLTGNNWLVSTVLLSSLAGFLGGVITSFEVGRTPEFVNFRDFKWAVIMWLVGACCSDILITVILVWHLRSHKTGFRASDDVVDRIIRLTVQTGFVTAVCAIIDLVLFLIDPTGLHLIFNFPLSKLYTNSLMSSLNSRGVWSYSQGPNVQYVGSLAASTQDQRETTKTQEYDACSRVLVHVESHQMRDTESGTQLSMTHQSVNESSLEKAYEGEEIMDLPVAFAGLNRNRHERAPFETYKKSQGGRPPTA